MNEQQRRREERARMDSLNREAEAERRPDDPMKVGSPRQAKPLIVMACAAMVAAVLVLAIMWVNNTRNHGNEPPSSIAQHK